MSTKAMSTSDTTYKVQNWSEYNDALVNRGRLTVWISEEAIEGWKHDGPPQQGAQWVFTDVAIETCLQIKVVYGLTLRETEGFVDSLFELMSLEEELKEEERPNDGGDDETMPVPDDACP